MNQFLKFQFQILAFALTFFGTISLFSAETPENAIRLLEAGNKRYVNNQRIYIHQDSTRRIETATDGQYPFVTMLSCSDSRCPTEIIFDEGIGDIFNIKVAGNIVSDIEIATAEYGVEHLHTPLLVVMGHTSCGAVTAACTNAKVEGKLPTLLKHIEPAVKQVKKKYPTLTEKELVPKATTANIWLTIEELFKQSEIISELVKEKKLKVVGALYDIKSGEVTFMDEKP